MREIREVRRPLPERRRWRPFGWFRALERKTAHLLSRYVWPWVPGVDAIYSATLERRLELGELELGVENLPQGFDGVRILFVSDLHAGPFVRPHVLAGCLERMNALRPDMIVLTGDIVSSSLAEYPPVREAFRALRAPLGVFAVPGNHDHYTGEIEALTQMWTDDGIQVLANRSVIVEKDGGAFTVAGVDDLSCGTPDLDAALARREGPVMLLSHHPDLFFEAARRDVDLVLAGHTHGGQIRFGSLPPLVRQSRYGLHEGRFRCRRTQLLVSRGIGVVGVPLRMACDPEAWLLSLARVEGDADPLRDGGEFALAVDPA